MQYYRRRISVYLQLHIFAQTFISLNYYYVKARLKLNRITFSIYCITCTTISKQQFIVIAIPIVFRRNTIKLYFTVVLIFIEISDSLNDLSVTC